MTNLVEQSEAEPNVDFCKNNLSHKLLFYLTFGDFRSYFSISKVSLIILNFKSIQPKNYLTIIKSRNWYWVGCSLTVLHRRIKCGHTKAVLPSFNEWQTFTFMTRRQTYAWKWPCSLIKVLVKDDGIKPVTLKCKNVITLQLLYYIYSFSFAWTKNMHFPHLNYMSSFSVTCKIILCAILTRRIGIIP